MIYARTYDDVSVWFNPHQIVTIKRDECGHTRILIIQMTGGLVLKVIEDDLLMAKIDKRLGAV